MPFLHQIRPFTQSVSQSPRLASPPISIPFLVPCTLSSPFIKTCLYHDLTIPFITVVRSFCSAPLRFWSYPVLFPIFSSACASVPPPVSSHPSSSVPSALIIHHNWTRHCQKIIGFIFIEFLLSFTTSLDYLHFIQLMWILSGTSFSHSTLHILLTLDT